MNREERWYSGGPSRVETRINIKDNKQKDLKKRKKAYGGVQHVELPLHL